MAYINGKETMFSANVNITEGVDIEIAQSTGNSETAVMSQKAVTDKLAEKFDTANIVQTTGNSETVVMSQKAVTEELNKAAIGGIDIVQTTGDSTTAVMSQKAASNTFYKNNGVATGVSANTLNTSGFYMLQADVTDTPASGVEISYMLVNRVSEYAITKYLFTVTGKLYIGIYSEKGGKMTTAWQSFNTEMGIVQTTGESTTAVMSQKAATDKFYGFRGIKTSGSVNDFNQSGVYQLYPEITDTPTSEYAYVLVNRVSEYAIVKYLFTVTGKLYIGIYSEKGGKMTTPWTIINGASYNKKIVMMGDSIFAIAGYQVFDENLAEELGCTVYNCAFGGTRFSDRGGTDTYQYFDFPKLVDAIISKNFTEQENNLTGKPTYYPTNLETLKAVDLSKIDVLVLNFGTNDFAGNVPLSNDTNATDTASLKGAMRYCIDKLLTAYPNLKIAINCPYYRFWVDTTNNNAFINDCLTKENTNGVKLGGFVEAEKEIANEFLLNCYDNLNNFGWNKYNRSVYFPVNDGVHFNATGVKYAAKALAANLKNGGYLA